MSKKLIQCCRICIPCIHHLQVTELKNSHFSITNSNAILWSSPNKQRFVWVFSISLKMKLRTTYKAFTCSHRPYIHTHSHTYTSCDTAYLPCAHSNTLNVHSCERYVFNLLQFSRSVFLCCESRVVRLFANWSVQHSCCLPHHGLFFFGVRHVTNQGWEREKERQQGKKKSLQL